MNYLFFRRYRNIHKHPDALVVANAGFNDATHYRCMGHQGSSVHTGSPMLGPAGASGNPQRTRGDHISFHREG